MPFILAYHFVLGKILSFAFLYRSLAATPEKVIGMVSEPLNMNFAEERVFGYFVQFIGNLNPDEPCLLSRFITGSSVVLDEKIDIAFNGTTGASRFPFAQTCRPVIVLPSTLLKCCPSASYTHCLKYSESLVQSQDM